ncbi:hypothetical protein KP509_18G021200 [Ceratopteris richardii]|uniref:Uncharacterized protein n=1 Tax=Ceratopteris richardii TaxID=49495 RepID=A0A8T2SRQ0_CERRI|nr:hypothetical protein KP509_18G021200 [Ceratopteris richardii]
MALCKHFCFPSGESSCSLHHYCKQNHHRCRLLSPVTSRNTHSIPSTSTHPHRRPSPFRPGSLIAERDGAGLLPEKKLEVRKSFSVREYSVRDNDDPSGIAGREEASFLTREDDEIDEYDATDDELGGIDGAIEDLVDLEELMLEDDEEEDDEGSEYLANEIMNEKSDIFGRVKDFCLRVQWETDGKITARDLAALYEFKIDKFQRLAIEGFLNGSSVVVCAPTSSGKTLIAECAAAATLAMQKRLFYTTPLKALSNQKLREFRTMFGEENVGLITGDAAINRDASILIMTTEILRNMLYQSIGTSEEGDQLHKVSAIVLDEVHYLSDISRGTVWEEVVIYCPKEVQLICLSATVANADEFAGWIAQVHGPTELVTSKRRPIPLQWHFSSRFSLSPLLSDSGTEMNRRLALGGKQYEGENTSIGKRSAPNSSTVTNQRGSSQSRKGKRDQDHLPRALSNEELQFLRRRQIPRVEETLKQLKHREMLPAIWFIFSRKGCDTAIKYVEDLQLLSYEEQKQVYEALTKFRKEHPDAVRESVVSALLRGFASHHAGCLPLWKSFIEELFQKGLIKVVFATETLAAGINMPARTTVLSSLSKRGENGHSLLSSNAMLQMAGRAGRRGLDERGHVVLVQTPFEGAEEGCKILFAGPDPLVSQFTASYGMVLNLLSSAKNADGKVLRKGRTLEEARALVEQSFGNYVGNEVKAKAMKDISKLEAKIDQLKHTEIPDIRSLLSQDEIDQYMGIKQELKVEKDLLREIRSMFEQKKLSLVQPLIEDAVNGMDYLPYVQLCYTDGYSGNSVNISALCFGFLKEPSLFNKERLDTQVSEDANQDSNAGSDVPYFVALGCDNSWYAFSATSVESIRKIGLRNVVISSDDGSVREFLSDRMPEEWDSSWRMVGKSGKSTFTSVWCAKGSYETLSWSRNIPDCADLAEDVQFPEEMIKIADSFSKQRKRVIKVKKEMKGTKASKEYWQIVAMTKLRDANIEKLEKKRSKLVARLDQMQPTGWQEFLQVVNVLVRANAISADTHEMLNLGKLAASIRGANELWLALALSENSLLALNPAHLAAVSASLVTEGIKVRSHDTHTESIYDPSNIVQETVYSLRKKQQWLLDLQNECGVMIACDLDDQLAGLVEAWASGVSWRELMSECHLDEGDLARLFRRTIDLLAQVPLLPGVDSELRKTATAAADLMERSPISELIA